MERYEQEGDGMAGTGLKDEPLAAFIPFSGGGDGSKQKKVTNYFQPADSEPFPRPELDSSSNSEEEEEEERD
jgi:hypothetical protein